MRVIICFALFSLSLTTTAFVPQAARRTTRFDTLLDATVSLMVDLPPTGSDRTAMMKIEPCLSVPSEMIEVRYKVPFDLNVAPQKNLAVCTKDGAGGEKTGDVLRYTSQWSLGLPQGDGLTTTVAAFSGGGLKWGCSMFDVLQAKDWGQVVEALVSNTQERTDEVVLIFERPLEEAPELK